MLGKEKKKKIKKYIFNELTKIKELLNVNSGSDPNIYYIWELLAKSMIKVNSIFIYNKYIKIENWKWYY